jgi:hypothetical protein
MDDRYGHVTHVKINGYNFYLHKHVIDKMGIFKALEDCVCQNVPEFIVENSSKNIINIVFDIMYHHNINIDKLSLNDVLNIVSCLKYMCVMLETIVSFIKQWCKYVGQNFINLIGQHDNEHLNAEMLFVSEIYYESQTSFLVRGEIKDVYKIIISSNIFSKELKCILIKIISLYTRINVYNRGVSYLRIMNTSGIDTDLRYVVQGLFLDLGIEFVEFIPPFLRRNKNDTFDIIIDEKIIRVVDVDVDYGRCDDYIFVNIIPIISEYVADLVLNY